MGCDVGKTTFVIEHFGTNPVSFGASQVGFLGISVGVVEKDSLEK